jgi:hypothetical protein
MMGSEPEAPFAGDELAHTSYRPTLVIGLGGTGLTVVRKLKRRLRRYFRQEELDIFQFLVFDTTAEDVGEDEEPLDPGEFEYLPAFDAAELIRHLDSSPYIADWWPGWPERPYRPTFSGTGAGRVRAVGRLVLFNYLNDVILPRIEDKIDKAVEINAQHGRGATSIKVYLVCSLAGGTGSGMVVDIAHLCRLLGLQRQPTVFVTGVLVTDEAFRAKAKSSNTLNEFRANTYAALREINHFATTREFRQQYNATFNTDKLPQGYRPFDVCYLLGLHNSQGQALEDLDNLTEMVASEMMLEIASPLAGGTTNILDNVRANDRFIAGQPTAFSSFALTSLVYPLSGVASWCALRGLGPFIRDALLRPRQASSAVDADVLAFAVKAKIEEEQADTLLEQLNLDDKGELLEPGFVRFDDFAHLPDSQLLAVAQRLEESALESLALVRESLAARVPAVEADFRAALGAEVETILRDPRRGPAYAQWWLKALANKLEAYRDEQMTPEQSYYRADMAGQEMSWKSSLDALRQALGQSKLIPWRGRALNNARADYVTALNAYLSAAHQAELRAQAVVCYNNFLDEARALTRRLNDLIARWNELADSAHRRAEHEVARQRATTTDFSLVHNVIGEAELLRTFEGLWPDLTDPTVQLNAHAEAHADDLCGQFWNFLVERVPDWTLAEGSRAQPDEGSPVAQSYYFLFDHLAGQLARRSLLDVMQKVYGKEWGRELALRYNQTAPFWNFSVARYADQVRNNLQHEPQLVGYGEDDLTRWVGLVNEAVGVNVDGINNKNPHEMLFLKTSHGLPLFALRTVSGTLDTAYHHLLSVWQAGEGNPIPLHVSRRWEAVLRSVEPENGESPEDGEVKRRLKDALE